MKKVSFIVSALVVSAWAAHAQNATAVFDVNEVRSTVSPKNSLFWDGIQSPDYEVPAGSGKHSMFLGNLWLVGKDANDLLHGYYNRYGFSHADTTPGPLTLAGGTTTQAIADQYKRVWKINQWEIDLLVQAQANGQLASGAYVPPADIAEWPANAPAAGYGNKLAPFHDADGDGIYDINDGDYPLIKGEQMLYFILNDRGSDYAWGVDAPLETGLEIHVSLYGCKKEGATDSTDIINYVTFLEYEIINRGTVALTDVYMGFNTDADIGYASDDYMGTHVDANAMYFVNGDAIDGQGTTPAPGQYGDNPPVQSIQFLEAPEPPASLDGYLMGGTMHYANFSGPNGDPELTEQIYNYLRTYWKNGSKMVYGGNGFPGSTGTTTLEARYMFPGDSDPANAGTGFTDPGFAWTQETPCPTCPQAVANDQRGMMASHPFSLAPSDTARLVLGLITTFLPDTSNYARVALNRKQNKQLKQWYSDGELPCSMMAAPLSSNDPAPTASLRVYPNPSADVVYVSGTSIQAGTAYELVDIQGRKLRSGIGQQKGTLAVSVDDLATGVYFIRLQAGGDSQIVKFIKK